MLCDVNDLITIVDCNFADNSASNGAGFYCEPNCVGEIIDSRLVRNDASQDGGAIYLNDSN